MITKITKFHLAELMSNSVILLWGIWLLWPFSDIFETYSSTYKYHLAVAPEAAWGIWGICIGALGLFGNYSRVIWARQTSIVLIIFHRLFHLTLLCISTGFLALSIPDLLGWLILALVAYMRLLNVPK